MHVCSGRCEAMGYVTMWWNLENRADGLEAVSPPGRKGFALVAVLVLLAALYLGATGIFLAARAELRIGLSHAASNQAFYLAESGLATWLASSLQPSVATYVVGGETVSVRGSVLIRVDSVTVLYRISSRAIVGAAHAGDPGLASREISLLGVRIRSDPVVALGRTWSEVY